MFCVRLIKAREPTNVVCSLYCDWVYKTSVLTVTSHTPEVIDDVLSETVAVDLTSCVVDLVIYPLVGHLSCTLEYVTWSLAVITVLW